MQNVFAFYRMRVAHAAALLLRSCSSALAELLVLCPHWCSLLVFLTFAFLVVEQYNRGALFVAALLIFALTSGINGYVTGTLREREGGREREREREREKESDISDGVW